MEAWLLLETAVLGNLMSIWMVGYSEVTCSGKLHVQRVAVDGRRWVEQTAVEAMTWSARSKERSYKRMTFGRDGCSPGSIIDSLSEVRLSCHT